MQAQANEIRAKCAAVFEQAKLAWPYMDFSKVAVRFDLKGRSAGQAGRRGDQYFMRFNADMLTREAFDHLLNETVPHEIAHIVCFMDPSLGWNHNTGWTTVARKLGCSGKRYHTEEVVRGKGTTYEYTTDRGHKVRVGDKHHAHVQQGGALRYKHGKGTIAGRTCTYSIVGYQGRTLSSPVHKGGEVGAPVQQKPVITAAILPAIKTFTIGVAPVAPKPAAPLFNSGESKASVARAIMLSGHRSGKTYDEIIAAIMHATGHNRQLSRSYYKNNAVKVGVPQM
jgi:predicted SprT family Zn-dependent metalloprotease